MDTNGPISRSFSTLSHHRYFGGQKQQILNQLSILTKLLNNTLSSHFIFEFDSQNIYDSNDISGISEESNSYSQYLLFYIPADKYLTLDELFGRGSLSEHELYKIILLVFGVVECLHNMDIVHTNIRVGNVFVSRKEGKCKFAEFKYGIDLQKPQMEMSFNSPMDACLNHLKNKSKIKLADYYGILKIYDFLYSKVENKKMEKDTIIQELRQFCEDKVSDMDLIVNTIHRFKEAMNVRYKETTEKFQNSFHDKNEEAREEAERRWDERVLFITEKMKLIRQIIIENYRIFNQFGGRKLFKLILEHYKNKIDELKAAKFIRQDKMYQECISEIEQKMERSIRDYNRYRTHSTTTSDSSVVPNNSTSSSWFRKLLLFCSPAPIDTRSHRHQNIPTLLPQKAKIFLQELPPSLFTQTHPHLHLLLHGLNSFSLLFDINTQTDQRQLLLLKKVYLEYQRNQWEWMEGESVQGEDERQEHEERIRKMVRLRTEIIQKIDRGLFFERIENNSFIIQEREGVEW